MKWWPVYLFLKEHFTSTFGYNVQIKATKYKSNTPVTRNGTYLVSESAEKGSLNYPEKKKTLEPSDLALHRATVYRAWCLRLHGTFVVPLK